MKSNLPSTRNKQENMNRQYSFFAPVNMDVLEDHSIEVLLYERVDKSSPPHPESSQCYSLEVHFPQRLEKSLLEHFAVCANLNLENVRITDNKDIAILYGGEIWKLKNREGFWCAMTPCQVCLRTHTRRCDSPNCSNNTFFRRRYIPDD